MKLAPAAPARSRKAFGVRPPASGPRGGGLLPGEAPTIATPWPADKLLPAAARAPSLSVALDATPRREADLVVRPPRPDLRGGLLPPGEAATIAAARLADEVLPAAVRAPSLSAALDATPRREADLVTGPSVRAGGGGTRTLLLLPARSPTTALACSGTGDAGTLLSFPRAVDRLPFGGAAVNAAAAVERAPFLPLPRVNGWLPPVGISGSRDAATLNAAGSPSWGRSPARAAARRRATPRVTGPLGAAAVQRADASRSTRTLSAASSSPDVDGDREGATDARPSEHGDDGLRGLGPVRQRVCRRVRGGVVRTASAGGSLYPRPTIFEPPRDAASSGRAGGPQRPWRGVITRRAPAVEEGETQRHSDGEHPARSSVGVGHTRSQGWGGGGQRQSKAVTTRPVHDLSTPPMRGTGGLAAPSMVASPAAAHLPLSSPGGATPALASAPRPCPDRRHLRRDAHTRATALPITLASHGCHSRA